MYQHVGEVGGGFGLTVCFQVDPLRGALGASEGADDVIAPQCVRDFRGADVQRRHLPGVEPDTHRLLQAVVLDALHVWYRRQPWQDVPLDKVTDTRVGSLRWDPQRQVKARIGGVGTTDLYRGIFRALWQFKAYLT